MKKLLLLFGLVLSMCAFVKAQTVNIDRGCVPLEVQFSAPTQSSYFWDFGDSDTSDKQNPDHAYVAPGDYVAILYDQQNGTEIGSIAIKVYEDITIEIVPDTLGGCDPFEVNFSAEIVKDPEIEIVSYLWSFGDGQSSTQVNPRNEYKDEGIFTVSVEITTSIGECDKTIRVEELITVEELTVFFQSDTYESCEAPAGFLFKNTSDNESGYTYTWDFGNGETSNIYNPDSVFYDAPGQYDITLTVDNGSVCVKSFIQRVTIGSQVTSEFTAPDFYCIGDTLVLTSNTQSSSLSWGFEGDVSIISTNNNTVSFVPNAFGELIVNLTSFNNIGCDAVSTDTIFIDPLAQFELTPEGACAGETEVTLVATNQNYQTYIWNDSIDGGPQIDLFVEIPERDSFYINLPETITQSLTVISDIGCTAKEELEFISIPPEAYFIPNKVRGCAPLSVTFTDYSTSNEEIVHSGWNYNDGNYIERVGEASHTHIFQEPGDYFVKLDIANEVNCIDTSKGVWIKVIDCTPPTPTGIPGLPPMGETITLCTGTDVEVTTPFGPDSEIQVHIESDDGRFDFCWNEGIGRHRMETPGLYPITATLEIDGFIIDSLDFGFFNVVGSRSEFSYNYSCDDIKTFTFTEESIDADTYRWFVDDSLASTQQKFTHTFEDYGEHEVILSTQNLTSGCPPHFNSVTFTIEETIADFTLPEILCANVPVILDASSSKVHEECCKANYNWIFDNQTQRCGKNDSIRQLLLPGVQEIKLIVEDAIGCPDSITKTVTVYNVEADFIADTITCLPATIEFENLTESIADIESYEWSFGSTEKDPEYEFSDEDFDENQIFVELIAEDIFGCLDTLEKELQIYEIESNIDIDNGPIICIGDAINFTGQIFDPTGEPTNFRWESNEFGSQYGGVFSLVFTESGIYEIDLVYSLENGDCENRETQTIEVIDLPIADMTTSVDDEFPICYPKIIEFMNTSTVSGIHTVKWIFDGETEIRDNNNPTFSFDKGPHTVDLIVRSFFGCSDTISRTFDLVAPEGTFDIDVVDLCFGDEFTVTLNSDTVDVFSYVWDMGDGTQIENQNPVTHTYNYNPGPDGNRSTIDLILRAADEGCETIYSVPVNIFDVLADFEIDTLSPCGEVSIINNSLGGDSFEWFIDGELISEEINPLIEFSNDISELDLQLVLTDSESGCISDTTIRFDVNNGEFEFKVPNIFTPNNDMTNDYFNADITTKFPGEVKIVTFKIYNRWGNLIYDNSNPLGWDGRYEGESVPSDVYAYYIEVNVGGCVSESMKGNVTIVR